MNSKQFEAAVADADTRLSRLRSLYEQWFAGVERLEPVQQRDAFDKLMKVLRAECPNNTAARFRQQQLTQRYVTYTTYWRRVSRQIEEGSYHRDVVKARRRKQARSDRSSERRDSLEIDVDLDLDMDLDLDRILDDAETLCAAPEYGRSEPETAPSSVQPVANGASRTFGVPTSEYPPAVGAVAPARVVVPSSPRSPVSPGSVARTSLHAHATSLPTPPPARVPDTRSNPGSRGPMPAPPPLAAATGAGAPRANPAASGPAKHHVTTPRPKAAEHASPAAVHPTPARQPREPATARRPAERPNGAQLSDQQIRAIYERYVSARRNNAERVDNVKLATIEKSVRAMMPRLSEKHAGKNIDFDVVVVAGKVALKPVAK